MKKNKKSIAFQIFSSSDKARVLVGGILAIGICASFLKDQVLSYFYGVNRDLDIFRVASFLPLAFSTSLIPIISGVYLPRLSGEKIENQTCSLSRIVIVCFLLAVGLSPFYLKYMAPGFSEKEQAFLGFANLYCWIIFVIGSLSFHLRISLLAYGRKIIVSSYSLISALSFSLVILVFSAINGSNFINLYLAFGASVVSSFLFSYYPHRKHLNVGLIIRNIFDFRRTSSIGFFIIIVAFLSHFLLALTRVIDRSYVSKLGEGMIGSLDYAYNFQVALGMLFGSYLVIVYSKYISENVADDRLLINLLRKATPMLVASFAVMLIIYFFGSRILVELVYARGAFEDNAVVATSRFLKSISLGLVPLIWNMLLFQLALAVLDELLIIICATVKIAAKWLAIHSLFDIDVFLAVGLSNAFSEIAYAAIVMILVIVIPRNERNSRPELHGNLFK